MTNLFIRTRTRPIGDSTLPIRRARRGLPAFVLAFVLSLALAQAAGAARTVYFADPAAGAIAQFAVGAGGTVTPLEPASVSADRPLRLAMSPEGDDLYATADGGILQYDVLADGRLRPKSPSLQPAYGVPFSIATHPDGASAYVTDLRHSRVLQYDIAGDGQAGRPHRLRAGQGWHRGLRGRRRRRARTAARAGRSAEVQPCGPGAHPGRKASLRDLAPRPRAPVRRGR